MNGDDDVYPAKGGMRGTLTMSGETVVPLDPALPLHRNGRLEEALSSFLCGAAVGVVVGTALATTRGVMVFFDISFAMDTWIARDAAKSVWMSV